MDIYFSRVSFLFSVSDLSLRDGPRERPDIQRLRGPFQAGTKVVKLFLITHVYRGLTSDFISNALTIKQNQIIISTSKTHVRQDQNLSRVDKKTR